MTDLVATTAEAVARIAYACSDIVYSVQSALSKDSEFTKQLQKLSLEKQPSVVAKKVPEIEALRYNADPFLSAFQPLRAGKLLSVLAPSSTLVAAIPHLFRLANSPVVIHVAIDNQNGDPDFSDISAIRQSGFSFLQSETIKEAQDIALTAHALAIKSGRGVIHFFDLRNSTEDDPIPVEKPFVIESVLELGQTRPQQQSQGDGAPGLYTDDVPVPTVVEEGLPNREQPNGSSATTNGVAEAATNGNGGAPATNGASTPASKDGSSVRAASVSGRSTSSSLATSVDPASTRPLSSEDVLRMLTGIWQKLESLVSRKYSPFVYTGPANAELAIFMFGSTGLIADELASDNVDPEYADIGLVTARLYRPWLGPVLSETLPRSVKKVAVLEQIRRKTTKWGPVLLDVLTSLKAGPGAKTSPLVVGYQLGYIEPSTVGQALKGITQNLKSAEPIQNLEVGAPHPPTQRGSFTQPLEKPAVENAYMKILQQVFGDRLHIANRLESPDAGISATTAASPEYGFGSLLARAELRAKFVAEVMEAARSRDFITEAPKSWLSKWCLACNDPKASNELAPEIIARLQNDGSPLANQLLDKKSLFFKESQWLVGSDAWAYDLANSGVHHVVASGENVNMLVIESQPYSEKSAADAERRKKDVGLYAMNYGNAYVASVAVYGSYTQVLEAMIEADRFEGPSVIVAYLPYEKENDSPLTVLQETKKAIDLGYWPLYRWDPHREDLSSSGGGPSFQLDSERIKKDLEEFLKRENQLTLLMKKKPDLAANLAGSYGTEFRALQKRRAKDAYAKLLDGMAGAPMTVLYASDNGNAEGLAKRLARRGKARGLKTLAMAMDEYPVEDLATEENVVLMTSTAGQGEFPQNGRTFWEAVKGGGEIDLQNTHFAVFALGDSHYWPRKEDKIYYNKPGKDLDARVAFLGGKRLVDVGLGDDQDPDTYQTAYKEWEPKLWAALGVDNVEGLPEEPPPITNEDMKRESNFLRGTIAEGLEDTSTGAISASDQQLTKFHGTYMQDDRDLRDERKASGLEPAYSFMIRCRLDGGVATPEQWLRMDAICDDHGNGTMKLTTRQTFQFHGVIKGKLRPAMRSINKALMTTIAACGDVNRNVMVSTLPQKNKYRGEVHEVAARIAKHLLPATSAYHEIWIMDDEDRKKKQVAGGAVVDQEPLYGPLYLPRKFKISIAIPPHNDVDVYAHDIGLIAIQDSKGNLEGFNVLIGGGMGVTHNNKKTYPRTGSCLGYVPAEKTHFACEKIMLVQRDNGDRTNRKHARLKYTVDDLGVDVFKGKVEELLGWKFEAERKFSFDSNIDTYGWVEDETGKHHFTMFIENGRVEDTPDYAMRTGLRELAALLKEHNATAKLPVGEAPEFRLTPNQHLCVSNIPASLLDTVKQHLAQRKLANLAHSALRLSSSACVAFPTCGLAMAESERYLPELVTKLERVLERLGVRHDSVVMRMTGCPNGCARPWVAEVAFVGKAYGAYNMYLGGGWYGQRLNKLHKSSIGEEEIVAEMEVLFGRWVKERGEGERFGDWCVRAGVVEATTEGKFFHEGVKEEESDEE